MCVMELSSGVVYVMTLYISSRPRKIVAAFSVCRVCYHGRSIQSRSQCNEIHHRVWPRQPLKCVILYLEACSCLKLG